MSDHMTLKMADFGEFACHRPQVSVWRDSDVEVGQTVVITIGALMGEQQRFVELTPAEARQLAQLLNTQAERSAEAA